LGVFADVPLIVDTSALTRWRQASEQAKENLRLALEREELWTTTVVRLEFLHDAFDRAVFKQRERMFAVYPRDVTLDAADGRVALQAIHDLAVMAPEHSPYRKVKAGDALVAAAAVREGAGVLHFDHDYERLGLVLPTLVQVPVEPF
jgi:predicted nucleic acid-binding protein